jgi:cell wall-associated NlpC family hydrolase
MSKGESAVHARPARLSEAALALVGAPFRLHGRDPATGLDCVGLVFASLAMIGCKPVAPRGYGLRNLSIDQWMAFAERSGLEPAPGVVESDDILLTALGYGQHHLMIAAEHGEVIHAHAGLRRVVRHQRDPAGTIIAKWRIAFPTKG